MNRKPLPPQHLLRERFDYDEQQGHLINRKNMSGRGGGIGSVVGVISKDGRRRVKFNGRKYYEHCLIWMWYYGEDIPYHLEIDHIDNDRDNNRIENLRLVTHEENQLNRKDTKENGTLYDRDKRRRERYDNDPEYRERIKAQQREYYRQRRTKVAEVD